jgi:hypothetical protein
MTRFVRYWSARCWQDVVTNAESIPNTLATKLRRPTTTSFSTFPMVKKNRLALQVDCNIAAQWLVTILIRQERQKIGFVVW